jgi:hypothetical protein
MNFYFSPSPENNRILPVLTKHQNSLWINTTTTHEKVLSSHKHIIRSSHLSWKLFSVNSALCYKRAKWLGSNALLVLQPKSCEIHVLIIKYVGCLTLPHVKTQWIKRSVLKSACVLRPLKRSVVQFITRFMKKETLQAWLSGHFWLPCCSLHSVGAAYSALICVTFQKKWVNSSEGSYALAM